MPENRNALMYMTALMPHLLLCPDGALKMGNMLRYVTI
jgi:hypothetical protein